MFRKLINSLLYAATVVGLGSTAIAQNNKIDNSILWEVSGNGLDKPSYLFGTIHMICNESYVHFNKLDSVYKIVDAVAVEMDITDPTIQMQLAQGLMSTDGKKLSDYFTTEEYNQIDNFIKKKMGGVSLSMFDAFHPAILVSLMSNAATPCDSMRSYDMEILAQSKKDNKNIVALDEVAVQINALKSIPIEDVIKSLKELSDENKNNSKSQKEMQKLVKAYRVENLKKLNKLVHSSDMTSGDAGVELLEKRNKSWIPIMESMMKEGPSLITFGAAHYVGDHGIIKLLRDKGYTVKPIKK